jgi:hypothetical protein
MIKRLRKTVALPPNPFWDRNRLFFEICSILRKEFPEHCDRDKVLSVEHLTVMQDTFPSIKRDREFIADVFALFRRLGLTVAVTTTSEELEINKQAENLADVIIAVDQLPTEGGSLSILKVNTKGNRGLNPENRVGFDPLREEICADALDTFKITPGGHASRVHINLLLPYYSIAEQNYAHFFLDSIASFVGLSHVSLTAEVGIDQNVEEPVTKLSKHEDPWPVIRKKTNTYDPYKELERLSAYPHDDLNVLSLDDYLLLSKPWLSKFENLLEPLGTADEWNDYLEIENKDDYLLDYVYNTDGNVIAVPGMIDIGVLAYKRPPAESRDKEIKSEVRLRLSPFEEILQIAKTIHPDSNDYQPPLSFTGFGLETAICFLWEFLEATRKEGTLNPEEDLLGEKTWGSLDKLHDSLDKLHELRGIMIKPLKKDAQLSDSQQKPWMMNPGAVCWRSWFSRLSCIERCENYLELRNSGIRVSLITGVNKRNLLTYRYLAIPRRASCIKLGKKIIKEYCCEKYAYERLVNLVGLSPYKKHYLFETKGEKNTSVFLPEEIAQLFRQADRSDFGLESKKRFITRNNFWKNYPDIHKRIGKYIQRGLFADDPIIAENSFRYLKSIVLGYQ